MDYFSPSLLQLLSITTRRVDKRSNTPLLTPIYLHHRHSPLTSPLPCFPFSRTPHPHHSPPPPPPLTATHPHSRIPLALLPLTLSFTHFVLSLFFIQSREPKLDDEALEEYNEAFNLFDKNKDGRIDTSELAGLMRHMGMNLTGIEFNDIVNECGMYSFSLSPTSPRNETIVQMNISLSTPFSLSSCLQSKSFSSLTQQEGK